MISTLRQDLKNWNRLPLHKMNLLYQFNQNSLTQQEKGFYIHSYELSKKDRSIPYIDRLLDPDTNHINQLRLFGSNYKDNKCFIYRFLDDTGRIIYIGKSTNMYNRMFGHFRSGHLPVKAYQSVAKIEYIILESQKEMNDKELYYILQYMPKYNKQGKKAHSHLFNVHDDWTEYNFLDELKGYIPELEDLKDKQEQYKQLVLDYLQWQDDMINQYYERHEAMADNEPIIF